MCTFSSRLGHSFINCPLGPGVHQAGGMEGTGVGMCLADCSTFLHAPWILLSPSLFCRDLLERQVQSSLSAGTCDFLCLSLAVEWEVIFFKRCFWGCFFKTGSAELKARMAQNRPSFKHSCLTGIPTCALLFLATG